MKTVDRPSQDVRAVRSRSALMAAARELVVDDPEAAITVSALCRRAEVSRPTFYQHFSSPDELLAAMIRARFDDLFASNAEVDRADTPTVIRRLLAEIWRDARIYDVLLEGRPAFNQVRSALERWLMERLAERYPGTRPSDLAFATGGSVRLIVDALSRGDGESSLDQTAADMWRLVRLTLGLS
ncbi:TetR/AcrR family transcriptional regulator [Nocardioides sp. cx-173]|uniref:TetR/AcrR family transcriptional regulator n=1 Tax=Nocardioides sp. cx-173 TaxID=2898796 RepID=UPI001E2EA625|nr:TetR/AcrR family transcriptional regulator [Nocardioides sp. cx-173]MCD4527364.1 TetR/AcrR family transcriptional regulator [Nocardioides sp. cx-173]UGB43983.1 TetR/AcrR family transcriptional regulator [Nocardioides sp. cx-173]